MTKIAGLTYVDEFTFPTEQGFTGSAGKHNVRGYYRGGAVKKDPVKAAGQKPRAPGPGAAQGGYMKGGEYEHMGGPHPEEEYPKSKAHQKMPPGVKARGGKMEYADGGTVGVTTPRRGKSMPQQARQTRAAKKSAKKAHGGEMSTHDKLRKEGEAMGYAYGGQVKNTSSEFVQTRSKQDTMDHANFPVVNEASQRDKESGPRKERRPRFNYGGKVRQVRDMPAKRRAKSGKGMPKGVKARGGLAAYAGGGAVEILGKGAARDTADKVMARALQRRTTLDEATAALRSSTGTTQIPTTFGSLSAGEVGISLPPAPPQPAASAKTRKPAPGSERGKRQHYGLQFKEPVIHGSAMEAAGGGVVTAAKGGRKKSRKMG